MMDEEGDVAHEFLNEVIIEHSASRNHDFEVKKTSTKAIKLKGSLCIVNGNIYLHSTNRYYS